MIVPRAQAPRAGQHARPSALHPAGNAERRTHSALRNRGDLSRHRSRP